MNINIRYLKPEDIDTCIKLFQETVHSVNASDYTADQLEIWAPKIIKPENEWWQTLLQNISLVAEINDEIVGFIDMTHTGYLDRLFVHKDYQRKGIAAALLRELENMARQQSISEITTEASITAKPFFEAKGYQVSKEQRKLFGNTEFINYIMKKKII